MSQIEINGIQYRTMKMPPRDQFHVLRRVSPLLGSISGAARALLDGTKNNEELTAELVSSIGPLTETLASMKDEDLDYVMNVCMLKVERLDPSDNRWHPVYVQHGAKAMVMYQDIDMLTELRLVSEMIKENLSGFFAGLNAGSAFSFSAQVQAPAQN